MTDPISVVKFFKGLVSAKSHVKTIAFVCIILFWLFTGYGVYKAYFKFVPTTTQKAETIQNIHNYPKEDSFFIGLKLFGFRIGISK